MEFRHKESAGIGESEISGSVERLAPYIDRMRHVVATGDYGAPEASLCLPGNESNIEEVKSMIARHASGDLKYIFLIGIGGSNLGAKAVYDALGGFQEAFLPRAFPRIFFLDTISSTALETAVSLIQNNILSAAEVLVHIASKSGMTLETIANAEIILDALKQKFGGAGGHIVVTTDKGSLLDRWAADSNTDVLHIPAAVGGRYSVLSPAGLFPLGLCGINIEALAAGARSAIDEFTGESENPAVVSAAVQFMSYKKGKTISDYFFFASELETLGKWTRQLMAESLGKEKDAEGNIVNSGFTPTVSIGSTDLHSVAQLYLGGPKDKYTNFVSVGSRDRIRIPEETNFKFLDADISSKSADSLLDAIYRGIKIAYSKSGLPFSEIILQDVSEKSLGEYMQFKMIETMLVGKLMNVNAFDQPAVESYKSETRRILGNK